MSSSSYYLYRRDDSTPTPACPTQNDYDGRDNLRILAVFMLLISSSIGVFFPILASRYSFIRIPPIFFFIAKFFGSGVIVATAFIHLLQPAYDELNDPCLGGVWQEYPWAFGICLMALFLIFFSELMAHYFIERNERKNGGKVPDPHASHFRNPEFRGHKHGADNESGEMMEKEDQVGSPSDDLESQENDSIVERDAGASDEYRFYNEEEDVKRGDRENVHSVADGKNENLVFSEHNVEVSEDSEDSDGLFAAERKPEDVSNSEYVRELVSVMILESGIIAHSIFIGLSLSVAGKEFDTLFVVLIFHQMFEGLGLGTRVAEVEWPYSKRYTPWILGACFGVTTPISAAIGIGVRHSWVPGSRSALIVNGIFDSISAGILIYTGLVELMAHEFLYANNFEGKNSLKKLLLAYFVMCCGCGLMALLGKWA
ncbi:hypothetical protein TBLA_0F02390 [Henningerozyma blattae CBS 6284]|uniref:Zinc/iron permease n=1 Tax=Henningerozyma blattae (strain ATCC 34711 / CBS 6284 / DSM 70876 / NBRC 10599 / NRRL Y-10934 / UCD 77-7) TaxID=1071380 RepID=I2H5X7_HENB6|nr:hypothetical protein TBLA_0F02390 [Tetrapisispora blattae CBS 6284]CCH61779.1 hypothetical protein TBLA_0F02390 [Tetrapisispora blattae CBS 6284]